MRLVLAAVAVLLIAAPAAHGRSGPCRTGHVPRVTAKVDDTKVGSRYAVVACDSARRVRVLRRTRVRSSSKRGPLGTAIVDAEAAGRFVVWSEMVFRRRRPVAAVLVEADRRGNVRRRRTVWRRQDVTERPLDVAVLRDGSVAWNRPRPRYRDDVMLDRPARPATAIGRLGRLFADRLTADDGRTLRWYSDGRRFTYRDVLPVPIRDGCPRRSDFRARSETDEYRVSEGGFGPGYRESHIGRVLRVCVRAERRDIVVDQDGGGDITALVAGWAVVWQQSADKYSCSGEGLSRVSLLRRPAPARRTYTGACGTAPRAGDALAVTRAGAVAWVDEPEPQLPNGPQQREPDTVLRATGPGIAAVELDRGAPGSITGLRLEGDHYRWTNAGVERSAPAE